MSRNVWLAIGVGTLVVIGLVWNAKNPGVTYAPAGSVQPTYPQRPSVTVPVTDERGVTHFVPMGDYPGTISVAPEQLQHRPFEKSPLTIPVAPRQVVPPS